MNRESRFCTCPSREKHFHHSLTGMICKAVFSFLLLFVHTTLSVPDEQLKEPGVPHHVRERYKRQPRIIGGTVTPTGAFEYFVRVDVHGSIACGGVLVAPDIVVTAGHCLISDALSAVVNGYDESKSGNLNRRQQFRDVTNALRHPDYDEITSANDIMLLKLSWPVYDIAYVQMNFDESYPPDDSELTVMGLGKTETGSYSPVLRYVTVQAINSNVCSKTYKTQKLQVPASIMLCAGSITGGKDSCQGDSGGPLVDSNDLLVGIASWAIGCARKEYPGVYTRISGFKKWLTDNVCSMSDAPPNWCPGSPMPALPAASPLECKDGDGTFQRGSRRRGRKVTCAQLKTKSPSHQKRLCVRTNAWDLCKNTCGRCGSNAGIYDAAKQIYNT